MRFAPIPEVLSALSRATIWSVLLLMWLAAPSSAQTPPTITVLGVGSLVMDVPLPPAEAMMQGYRFYLPATATTGSSYPLACTGTVSPPLAICVLPLSTFNLPVGAPTSIAITAFRQAADGIQETARVTAPFVLSRVGPPVAPAYSATPIRPPSP